MTTWTLSPTITFLNELLNLPKQIGKQVLKKLTILESDPYSAKGEGKKIKGTTNQYPVCIGDYHLIYTIGTNWLKLLSENRSNELMYAVSGDKLLPEYVLNLELIW